LQEEIRPEPLVAAADRSAGDGRSFAAGSHHRFRWGLVARSLFIYLLVIWLLVRDLGDRPGLAALAVLAGFPMAALIARRLGRGQTTRFVGAWGVIGLAVAGALVAPLLCLEYSRGPEIPLTEVRITADAEPYAALANADLSGVSDDGLRLRIRGLSVVEAAPPNASTPADVEIILVTALEEWRAEDPLLITVRLVDAADGGVIWSRRYRGDPTDLKAVRRLVIKALTEAMSLTREGIARGQLV